MIKPRRGDTLWVSPLRGLDVIGCLVYPGLAPWAMLCRPFGANHKYAGTNAPSPRKQPRRLLRALLNVRRLQLRRTPVRVVERVPDERHRPTRQQGGPGVALDQRKLAGRQKPEKLRRLGETDGVRLRDRPDRRGRPVPQNIAGPLPP